MIIKAFAEALHLEENIEPCKFLQIWLKRILSKKPKNHVENVIHTEFFLQQAEDTTIVASNSPTGQNLMQSLYNFCLSYENFLFARWLHEKNVNDFIK